jgi:hypothetical protein
MVLGRGFQTELAEHDPNRTGPGRSRTPSVRERRVGLAARLKAGVHALEHDGLVVDQAGD